MKYAIRNEDGEWLSNLGGGFFCGILCEARTVNLFDTQEDALSALRERDRKFGEDMGYSPARLMGIEEIPGETRREVVELEGQVDLTGLKFAVRYDDRECNPKHPESEYLGGLSDGQPYRFAFLHNCSVYDTIGDLVDALEETRGYFAGEPRPATVVGIREVTAKPSYCIVDL